jgi:SAM-dependent methyltransferase
VLEVGCGHGAITPELVRRAPGDVIALDRDIRPALTRPPTGASLLAGDARALPLAEGFLDLVFCANVLMWTDAAAAAREAARVLQPGGALVAMEPDYGGMMEHPPEVALREVWLRALAEAGADPLAGRKLPGLCEAAGLEAWVELQAVPQPATAEALGLLRELALTREERERVEGVEERIGSRQCTWEAFVHVPYMLVVATKRR